MMTKHLTSTSWVQGASTSSSRCCRSIHFDRFNLHNQKEDLKGPMSYEYIYVLYIISSTKNKKVFLQQLANLVSWFQILKKSLTSLSNSFTHVHFLDTWVLGALSKLIGFPGSSGLVEYSFQRWCLCHTSQSMNLNDLNSTWHVNLTHPFPGGGLFFLRACFIGAKGSQLQHFSLLKTR